MTDEVRPGDGGDSGDAKSAGSSSNGAADPWADLVKRTEANPGVPFAPDNVRDLGALKRVDRVRFETLRDRLKKAGCRVTELDKLIAKESGEALGGGEPSQADILVALAEAAELFQTPDEEACADLEVNGHRETWLVGSRGFTRWLRRRFHEETGSAPSNESVKTAIGVIEAKALYDAEVRPVYVRVGGLDGKLYLDLCDKRWRVIEIDEAGWRIVDRPAIRFRRTSTMRALPEPEPGGSIAGLRKLLNIPEGPEGDVDFVLAVVYELACIRPRGPYPVMAIGGEQGTAKSTRSSLLRSVVDPGKPTLRALPRDERDLVIAAHRRHVLAFDNVSELKWWLSDALCRVASGAGFGTRELYTDQDEVVFEGARPIILNGIEDIVERPDLAERAIFSICQPIAKADRLSEAEIEAEFRGIHASVLGALLDATVVGIRTFPKIRPPDLPRMADFAHWGVACEQALWEEGAFMRAYDVNIRGAVETVLEASPVATAVRALMDKRPGPWTGTVSELLEALELRADERTKKSDAWPHSPRGLSGRLRRAAPALRRIGVDVAFTREANTGARQVTIKVGAPT
jgi:hypothetical protein